MSRSRCFAAQPLRLRQFELPLPPPAIAAAQLASPRSTGRSPARCSTCCCRRSRAAVPRSSSASFSSRILLGMASHVPGGVGVFEGLMVLLLEPYLSSAELLPPLVVYRAVYYLLPLSLGARRASSPTNCGSAGRRSRGRRALLGRVRRDADAARAGHLHVPRRRSCCSSRARRRPRRAGSPSSTGCCRSASSRRRTSSAAWPARRCCSCRRGWRGGSTPRTI